MSSVFHLPYLQILMIRVVIVILLIAARSRSSSARARILLIELLQNGLRNVIKLLLLLLIIIAIRIRIVIQPINHIIRGLEQRLLILIAQSPAQFLLVIQLILQIVRRTLQLILGLHSLGHSRILLRKLLRIAYHLINLLLTRTSLIGRNGNALARTRSLIVRTHIQNTIGINLESHLHLRHTTRRGRNARQLELAQQDIVLRHRTLALKHLNEHRGLIVLIRRKHLRLLGGNHAVLLNQLRHHSAHSLNPQTQRSHIQQEDSRRLIRRVASENRRLHRRTIRHRLIGVDTAIGLLTIEKVLDQLLDFGNARRSADEHNLVNLALLHSRVLHHHLQGLQRLTEQIIVQLFETRARQSL